MAPLDELEDVIYCRHLCERTEFERRVLVVSFPLDSPSVGIREVRMKVARKCLSDLAPELGSISRGKRGILKRSTFIL